LERIEPLVLEELNIKELYTDSLARVAGKEDSGYVVVGETSNNVAVSTYITVELEAEGIAREIVHRVQTMRRTAGYDIADHIITYYEGDAAFVQAISAFADYIRQETLSRELEEGVPEDADFQETYKISGHSLLLGVKRAG